MRQTLRGRSSPSSVGAQSLIFFLASIAGIKHGIVWGGMAHQGVKQRIDLSIIRLATYKALRDEIMHYSRACRTWTDPNANASRCSARQWRSLLTEFMNLLFSEGHRAWKGEKTLNQHPLLLLLSNFFAAGGKSTGSKLPSPQRMEKGRLRVFREDRSWQQSGALWPWTCAGSVVRWRLYSNSSCSKPISDQVKCCHSNPRVSWHQRRWSPKLGDTVVPSGPHREHQNWRSRRYDQSRLKTMFVDRASVRKALRRQPQDKVFLNLNYAEYLLLLRRAAANLQVDMVPYQGRDSGASVDRAENLRTLESIQEPRTMEISQVCAPLRKKGTCQPKLVRARSIGPGTMRALQQPPALSIASRSRLSDTASTAPSFVIDLFSANTDLQQDVEQFFLNRGVQCAKLDLSFMMTAHFSTSVQEILGILASGRTLAAMVSPPVSSLSVARSHRPLRSATRPWRLAALKFSCKCQVTKDSLCVAACLRVVRACIS